jgi:hypothetical protein
MATARADPLMRKVKKARTGLLGGVLKIITYM